MVLKKKGEVAIDLKALPQSNWKSVAEQTKMLEIYSKRVTRWIPEVKGMMLSLATWVDLDDDYFSQTKIII